MKRNFSISCLALFAFVGCSGSTFGGKSSEARKETPKVAPKTTTAQDATNALPKDDKAVESKDAKGTAQEPKKSEADIIKDVVKNYAARDKCSQIAWELRPDQGKVGLGYGLIHDCVLNKAGDDVLASEQSRKIGTAAGEAFYTGYAETPNGKELISLLTKVTDAGCKMPTGLMSEFALKMQMTCAVYGKSNGYIVKSMVADNFCKAWVFEGITTPEGCLKRCTQYSYGTPTVNQHSWDFSPDTYCQFLENEVPGFVKPVSIKK